MEKFKEIYETMFLKRATGEISDKEWQEFCLSILDILMQDNQDVLIRLKNC